MGHAAVSQSQTGPQTPQLEASRAGPGLPLPLRWRDCGGVVVTVVSTTAASVTKVSISTASTMSARTRALLKGVGPNSVHTAAADGVFDKALEMVSARELKSSRIPNQALCYRFIRLFIYLLVDWLID